MAHPVAVILVVGLTESLIGESSPRIREFASRGRLTRLKPVLPAVTCSVQSSMLTGLPPREHGIVGNGWYNRELAEVQFWKQSNHLVQGEKVWETARKRDPSVTCANLFWWFNMYSSVEYSVTPRPIYKADGRKIPDVYTNPPELRERLQSELGRFPLFAFWGPGSSIVSSRWIAAAAKIVHKQFRPTLNLVYLPHLDYALQKFGPGDARSAQAVREIDAVVGDLIDYFNDAGVRVMLVSEYGIEAVDQAICINRHLRQAGGLAVREEDGGELLDAGASEAFAVADHQIAHVYVRDPARISHYASLCAQLPGGISGGGSGVERVLDRSQQAAFGIDHERAGELVLIAAPGCWFNYQYWLDDARAPDFARTVDIHRKPGYDPLELFFNPAIGFPKLTASMKLLRRKLGFRTLFDVIPLDSKLVKGSHGRIDISAEKMPVLIAPPAGNAEISGEMPCQGVRDAILRLLFGP